MLENDTSYNDESIETIEARIHQLERVLQSSHADSDGTPILPRLTGISKEMGQALSGRDRIAPLVRRLKELQGYLEPTFGESKGLSADVKADIILASRTKLIDSQLSMSEVASKAKVLDMTLEELPQDKLVKLAEIHNDQEDRAEALGQSTLDLIAQYNDIMATITETFVRYDEILKAAENLKRAKQDQPDL